MFFDLFTELARACLGFGASVEIVRGRASAYGSHNRTAALLDSDMGGPAAPGPDLTWQRTLAVAVCAALSGVFKKRKYEIEFN